MALSVFQRRHRWIVPSCCITLFSLRSLSWGNKELGHCAGKHVLFTSFLGITTTGLYYTPSLGCSSLRLPRFNYYCLLNNGDLLCSLPCSCQPKSLVRRQGSNDTGLCGIHENRYNGSCCPKAACLLRTSLCVASQHDFSWIYSSCGYKSLVSMKESWLWRFVYYSSLSLDSPGHPFINSLAREGVLHGELLIDYPGWGWECGSPVRTLLRWLGLLNFGTKINVHH